MELEIVAGGCLARPTFYQSGAGGTIAAMDVVLYARAGCHLCDTARDVILAQRERTPFAFEEIDIETSETLVREYGMRIPVVVVDGRGALRATRWIRRSSPRW